MKSMKIKDPKNQQIDFNLSTAFDMKSGKFRETFLGDVGKSFPCVSFISTLRFLMKSFVYNSQHPKDCLRMEDELMSIQHRFVYQSRVLIEFHDRVLKVLS